LIIGNIQKGTNMMRLSYVANRFCNIVNHVVFANVVAVVIAVSAIISNAVYYLRLLNGKLREGKTAPWKCIVIFAVLLAITIVVLLGFVWIFSFHFAELPTEDYTPYEQIYIYGYTDAPCSETYYITDTYEECLES
jgi:peptidoglycan biosynthesis protein MviN/MurJ (putative lipid II flippase)